MLEVRAAAKAFCPDGGDCPIERLGAGNINDTFLIKSAAVGDIVLQRINGRVFPDPRRVIENFAIVTEHVRRTARDRDLAFHTASPVKTLAGTLCFGDGRGGWWRGQTYLEPGPVAELPDTDRLVRAGAALARFHLLTADLDVGRLADPLPGFHHLPGYLEEFDRVVRKPQSLDGCRYCLESVERIRPGATLLEDARNSGVLAVQPVHGDPKLDNFIFSLEGTGGLLDFDTVGAGLVHVDLADCLRSCCNRAGETGGDLSAVSFELGACRSILAGYFSEDAVRFSSEQLDLIFEAVLLIAFELGLRFFTDHLRGNTYFRVNRDGENLTRAVRQFRLVEDIAAKEREIRRLVAETFGASRAAAFSR